MPRPSKWSADEVMERALTWWSWFPTRGNNDNGMNLWGYIFKKKKKVFYIGICKKKNPLFQDQESSVSCPSVCQYMHASVCGYVRVCVVSWTAVTYHPRWLASCYERHCVVANIQTASGLPAVGCILATLRSILVAQSGNEARKPWPFKSTMTLTHDNKSNHNHIFRL